MIHLLHNDIMILEQQLPPVVSEGDRQTRKRPDFVFTRPSPYVLKVLRIHYTIYSIQHSTGTLEVRGMLTAVHYPALPANNVTFAPCGITRE